MVSSPAISFVTSTHRGRKPRLIDLADQVVDKILGPMPVQEFLEEFLPRPKATLPPLKSYQEEIKKVWGSKEEQEMYGPLVKAIQNLCRNFSVVDTHDKPFPVFRKMRIGPDISIYPRNKNGDISKVEIMIKVKYRNDCDPFLDSRKTRLVDVAELPSETLGQIASYASAHQAAQFRSYIFSLLVFPTYAKILRWDRSGVIVTNKIPWSSPDLPEFFHRFDCMTAEQRGIDPTITKPSSSNERRARRMFQIGNDIALIQLTVGGSDYIVPRDTYMGGTRSPLGRSTRAYSLSLKKLVFLKDTWRVHSQTAEHDLYAKLKEKGVPYIATCLAGGDVLNQQTRTRDFVEKKPSWAKDRPKKLRKHSHYRLVLEEIASPLTTFSSTKLLVKIMHEALIAHKNAYEEAKILHRDISPNNIMIYKGSALLIDWDLSKNLEDNEHTGESERIGTWQFTAARLLDFPMAGPQTLTDDIESFVHVLTWTAIRYADHGMTKEELTCFLQRVFNHSFTDEKGDRRNGFAKCQYLRAPVRLEDTEFKSPNLKSLLLYLTDVVATRYRNPTSSEVIEQWKSNIAALNSERKCDADKATKKYKNRLEALKSSDWIIQTFAYALSRDNWPENDAAEEHELAIVPSGLETTTQQTDSEEVDSVGNDQEDKDASSSEGESDSNERYAKKARLL